MVSYESPAAKLLVSFSFQFIVQLFITALSLSDTLIPPLAFCFSLFFSIVSELSVHESCVIFLVFLIPNVYPPARKT